MENSATVVIKCSRDTDKAILFHNYVKQIAYSFHTIFMRFVFLRNLRFGVAWRLTSASNLKLGWVGWVELVGLFTCSIGNQLFSVGLVDQLFQPTRNLVELVENDGYRPLSQSRALIRCVMSINAILFNKVGVWSPLSPVIRPCFQLFQPKPVEMRSIGALHQPKSV